MILIENIRKWLTKHFNDRHIFDIDKDSINNIGVPVIQLKSNGHTLNFVVDTGCGVTTVSHETLKLMEHKPLSIKNAAKSIGVEGVDKMQSYAKVWFDIDGSKTLCVVSVSDISKALDRISRCYEKPIHGLLGSNFLEVYKGTIHYGHKEVTSTKKKHGHFSVFVNENNE